MIYRKASPNDAGGIAKVLVESYNINSDKEGMNTFRKENRKKSTYLVASDRKKITGLVTWVMHGLPKHGLCELDRIAVLPEYRGRGIAKGLFNLLIKDAKGFYKKNKSKLRKLYLLCHADNTRAHKFYKKMGLKRETTLKHHYYNNKDEFVFSMFFK
jgi:[ribosomal protein S18]-alanine N-acetyltransferase